MPQFIEARDIRHHFGGQKSATPYTPTADESGAQASVIRTPTAKPEPLESIFARIWAEHGNGTRPVREYCFHDVRKWRFDFAFPDSLVAVECDGVIKKAGGGRHNTDGDRDKLNHAAALGFRILRFSRMQLEDQPEHCAELVKRALEF